MASGSGGGGREEAPIEGYGDWSPPLELEDAAKPLVEVLVKRFLRRGGLRRKAPPPLDNQKTVARQVQAMVLLYNYYHRKQFPHLAFADPERFIQAALSAADDTNLDAYLKYDAEAGISVADWAVEDACGIADALDADKDSPPWMSTWPISKVAVLLVDQTGNKCLIERSSVTEGVWSLFEKDIKKVCIDIDLSAPLARTEEERNLERYMLQAAYSMVERKTGMKYDSLLFLGEHLVYSLSKKTTTAKLFVFQYVPIVNSKLTEMAIEDLISRMSGPIFINEACPKTTSVVEYYHILPYKEVLLNLLNRERSLDSSQIIPKEQPLVNETTDPMGYEESQKHLLSLSYLELRCLCIRYNLPADKSHTPANKSHTHTQLASLLASRLKEPLATSRAPSIADLELKDDGLYSYRAAMLHQLHMKAKEKLAELDSSTPDAVLLDKIHEK
ncbi:hypothetical protein EJB05_42386, partial [Eragrostis curvula]